MRKELLDDINGGRQSRLSASKTEMELLADLRDFETDRRIVIARIKEIKKQIRDLRKSNAAKLGVNKIDWNTIAFQRKIYSKMWEYAGGDSVGDDIRCTLDNVVNFIKRIPGNKKKKAASLLEIEKLKRLPAAEQLKRARAYCHNKSASIDRNRGWWVCK